MLILTLINDDMQHLLPMNSVAMMVHVIQAEARIEADIEYLIHVVYIEPVNYVSLIVFEGYHVLV